MKAYSDVLSKRMKITARVVICILTLLVSIWLGMALTIHIVGQRSVDMHADAAIVLGAAIVGEYPSPVYKARLDHAIALFHHGRVRFLALTGGVGKGERWSEAQIGKNYAIRAGVPAAYILIEEQSRTTFQNFYYIVPELQREYLKTALIVSDPQHLMRSVAYAKELGLNALPSPATQSRYKSFLPSFNFVLREAFFYIQYRVFCLFWNPSERPELF